LSVDRPTIRLVHTSDVHIGDDHNAVHRLKGLTAVVDAAVQHSADALLIVGDLFDSSRVNGPDVEGALAQLARVDIPVLVTSGNHDVLDQTSIYHRVALSDAGAHVYFLDDPAGAHLVIEELGLSLWARAMVDHHPGHKPLESYEPARNGHWQVVMAHGHYVPGSETTYRSSPILEDEIAGLACDYLALGHWHRYLDVSVNGIPAYYPGSPSEPGDSFASVNLVVLDPATGVTVERVALPLD
jgi:DNA repair exonuclease SbcCD nuclease subunit